MHRSRVASCVAPLVLVAAVASRAAPPQVDEPVGGSSTVTLSRDSAQALLARWDVRALAVRTGDAAQARAGLADVGQSLLDAGVQGLPGGYQAPAIAEALVREAHRAFAADKRDAANSLLEAAQAAAPDLVTIYTARALFRWKSSDARGAMEALGEGVAALRRDPNTLAIIGAHAVGALCLALVTVLLLVALCTGLPALRLLAHDVRQRLPRGASATQVSILVMLAAFLPVIAGGGVVLGALWLLTLGWLHLTARERTVAMTVALACLAIPVAVDHASRLLSFPASRTARAVRAFTDMGAADVLRELEASREELTLVEQLALAQAAKRAGDLPLAATRYEALLKTSDDPLAHAGYGVVAALQGNEDRAVQAFEKATSLDSRAWSASFNVSAFHFRRGRVDLSNAAISRLTEDVPELLFLFRSSTFRQADQKVTHNRAYADIFLKPETALREGLQRSSSSAALAASIERRVFAGLEGRRVLFALGLFPVLWLVLGLFRSAVAPSCACVRCGSPASRRGAEPEAPHDTCSQCFHAFVSTKTRIDAQIKLKKERDVVNRRRRVAWSVVLLSALWPGVGHMVGNATLRGFVFLVLHTLGVITLVVAGAFVSLPALEAFWGKLPMLVPAGLVVAVIWLLAFSSAWSVAEEARTGR